MFQLLNTAHVQNLPPLLALRFRARDFCSFAASVTPTFKLSPSLRMWTMLSLICTFTPTPNFALPPTPTPKIEKKADEEMPSVSRLRAFPYIYIYKPTGASNSKMAHAAPPAAPAPAPPCRGVAARDFHRLGIKVLRLQRVKHAHARKQDGHASRYTTARTLRKFNKKNVVMYLQTLRSCIGANEWRSRWLQ